MPEGDGKERGNIIGKKQGERMRYLLTSMMFFLLAAPARSQCGTPNKHLGPFDDDQLPQSLGPYSVTDCDSLDFGWEFVRTTQQDPLVTIILEVAGTECCSIIYSSNYDHGQWYSGEAACAVTDTIPPVQNTLKMIKLNTASGCFKSISIYAANYR